jgi:hypothetical protein
VMEYSAPQIAGRDEPFRINKAVPVRPQKKGNLNGTALISESKWRGCSLFVRQLARNVGDIEA